RTISRQVMVLQSESKLSTEVRLVDARKPDSAPILVEPRADNIKYEVDHDGKNLVIRANDTGRNYRVATASPKSPGRSKWKELVPHDDAVMIDQLLPLNGRIILHVWRA